MLAVASVCVYVCSVVCVVCDVVWCVWCTVCGGVVWCCVAASDFENMGENRCMCNVSGEMCGVRQGHFQLPAGDSPSFKQGSQARP